MHSSISEAKVLCIDQYKSSITELSLVTPFLLLSSILDTVYYRYLRFFCSNLRYRAVYTQQATQCAHSTTVSCSCLPFNRVIVLPVIPLCIWSLFISLISTCLADFPRMLPLFTSWTFQFILLRPGLQPHFLLFCLRLLLSTPQHGDFGPSFNNKVAWTLCYRTESVVRIKILIDSLWA